LLSSTDKDDKKIKVLNKVVKQTLVELLMERYLFKKRSVEERRRK